MLALSPDSAERGRRLAGAAEAAWLAGTPERARALLFAAQDQSSALPLRTEVAYLRGSIELASGSVDYAMTVLRDAAAERLGSSMPRQSATPLLIRAMDAAMAANDVPQAIAIGHMSDRSSTNETWSPHSGPPASWARPASLLTTSPAWT